MDLKYVSMLVAEHSNPYKSVKEHRKSFIRRMRPLEVAGTLKKGGIRTTVNSFIVSDIQYTPDDICVRGNKETTLIPIRIATGGGYFTT